jgi:hypothetical protein
MFERWFVVVAGSIFYMEMCVAVCLCIHFPAAPLPDLIPPVQHYFQGPYDNDDTTFDCYYEENV